MSVDHDSLLETLHPGRPDVVRVHGFEHRRPQEAHRHRCAAQGQRQAREYEVAHRVEELLEVSRYQGVDAIQPGNKWWRSELGTQPSDADQAKIPEEDYEQQDRYPERGRRIAGDRKDPA